MNIPKDLAKKDPEKLEQLIEGPKIVKQTHIPIEEYKRKVKRLRKRVAAVVIPLVMYTLTVGTLDFMKGYHERKAADYEIEALFAQEMGRHEEVAKYVDLIDEEQIKSERYDKWFKRLDFIGIFH